MGILKERRKLNEKIYERLVEIIWYSHMREEDEESYNNIPEKSYNGIIPKYYIEEFIENELNKWFYDIEIISEVATKEGMMVNFKYKSNGECGEWFEYEREISENAFDCDDFKEEVLEMEQREMEFKEWRKKQDKERRMEEYLKLKKEFE